MNRYIRNTTAVLVIITIFSIRALSQNDTSNIALSNNPLYMVDGKASTKAEVEKLDKGTIKSLDVWKGEEAVKKFGEKGRNGIILVTTKDVDFVFTKTETNASFPGGINAWRRYLERNLNYPVAAQKNNTQGAVRVQMVVSKDGKISEVQALNDPGDGLAAEAVRVIKNGPDWVPAEQGGRRVTYRFVQTITFRLGSGTSSQQTHFISIRTNQTIIVKTPRLYNGITVEHVIPTYDLKGADVMTTDGKSYFVNRDEAMQQFGIIITDKEFVAPEDAKVLYHDNNGVATDSYKGLKFVGGKRSFHISSLYLRGTKKIDIDKQPVFVLNGKEVTAEEIQQYKLYEFRASNLLKLQDEAAFATFGVKGKNGILLLYTKLPYPDNYLYLLNGKESSNEEIARLEPGTIDSMITMTGKRAVETYGDKAKYGVVKCKTRTGGASNTNERIFTKTPNPASFPGGDDGWKKYTTANLQYPAAAKKNKIEGTVRVSVIVDSIGKVTRALPTNDPGSGLAQEAVRLLKEGPQWIPASINGKNVAYTLIMSVTFKLDPVDYF